jgi:hypothetical protein
MSSEFAADVAAAQDPQLCPVGRILAGLVDAARPYDEESLKELGEALDTKLESLRKDPALKVSYEMLSRMLLERGYEKMERRRLSEHANGSCSCRPRRTT